MFKNHPSYEEGCIISLLLNNFQRFLNWTKLEKSVWVLLSSNHMLRLEMMVDSTLNVKEDEVDEALKAATLD